MRIILLLLFLVLIGSNFSLANENNFIYDSNGKRDPFVSLLNKNVKLTDVRLLKSVEDIRVEGVIIDKKNGSGAVLNGNIIKVGEFLGGFKLMDVSQYYVILERDEKRYKIKFRDEIEQ